MICAPCQGTAATQNCFHRNRSHAEVAGLPVAQAMPPNPCAAAHCAPVSSWCVDSGAIELMRSVAAAAGAVLSAQRFGASLTRHAKRG
jgi:hypothetical protein